jgi:hypothetical protein
MIKIKRPNISPNFTIDDIHKIRNYHQEIRNQLSHEDKIRSYNDRDFFKKIMEIYSQ